MRRFAWLALFALAVVACPKGSAPEAPHNTPLTRETHARFPIAAGNHAAAACNDCHGQFDTFKGFACTGCHEVPKITPLHAGVAGFATDGPSCYRCHPTGEASNAVDHAKVFPIGTGTRHDAISCSTCHLDPNDRSVLGCANCHTQADTGPRHSKVGGYQWSSPACLRCHADAQVARVAAHPTFQIDTGAAHFQQSCLVCHPALRADKPWAADFTQKDCTACHTEAKDSIVTRHNGIAQFAADTASCLKCHADGQVGNFDHAKWFPIAAAAKDVHAAFACARCHVSPTDRSIIDCTVCHDAADQAAKHQGKLVGTLWSGTGPVPGASANCLLCHAGGALIRVNAHPPPPKVAFDITPGARHGQACELCHETRATSPDRRLPEISFAATTCTDCHSHPQALMDQKHSQVNGYTAGNRDGAMCLRCHADGVKHN